MTAPEGTSRTADADRPEVSIILATLNERRNLPELFDRLQALPLGPTEIIVVDDGSTDGTREFLTDRSRQEPAIKLVWHDGKQTTVRAQAQGISVSLGDLVVVMDADLQHPPEVLPAMLAALRRGASLVIGSRYAAGGSSGPRDPMRGTISRGAELTAKFLLPEARAVSDPVSGFFAFRRDIYRPLPREWRGYKLLLFLLVMARGRTIAEVGFRFEPRGSGSSKVTQNSRFIRYFLTELLLANRFRESETRGRSSPPAPHGG